MEPGRIISKPYRLRGDGEVEYKNGGRIPKVGYYIDQHGHVLKFDRYRGTIPPCPYVKGDTAWWRYCRPLEDSERQAG